MTQSPWIFVSIIMVTGFLVVAQSYAILPLIAAIGVDLNVTVGQASFIPSAFGLAYAFGFLIFGPLADKTDRMTMLVAGLGALATTSAGAALASTYHALVAARILQGLAAASFPATALALMSQTVTKKDQPLAISMLGFAFLSSAPLSQLLVGAGQLSFPVLMWGLAGLYLLCAAAILASGNRRAQGVSVPAASRDVADTPAARQMPPVAACVIAPATVLLSLVSFHALARLLADAETMIDLHWLRIAGFPPLFLCFLAPAITGRYGPAVTACCGLVISALGMSGAALGLGLSLASIMVSAGAALAVPGLIASVTFWSGEKVRARALASYTFFLFAGASVAPVLASTLFRIDALIGFAVPGLASLIGAVLLYLTRPGPAVPSTARAKAT